MLKNSVDAPPRLCDTSTEEMSSWLSVFVVEICRQDGKPYPSSTLKHVLAGIQWHLHSEDNANINLLKDPSFSLLRKVLDSKMNDLRSEGVGLEMKQADLITEEEETRLWDLNILGDSSPQQLVDTVTYCTCVDYISNLWAYRRLCVDQLQLHEPNDKPAFIVYHETISEANSGGLAQCKLKPKRVEHFASIAYPKKCFVHMYKKYRSLCPAESPADAFYLIPLRKPRPDCQARSQGGFGWTPL